jgi:hypothetical protein
MEIMPGKAAKLQIKASGFCRNQGQNSHCTGYFQLLSLYFITQISTKMKSSRLTLAFVLLAATLFAQEFKFPKHFTTSTVGITDTKVMVDVYEVSLGDWFSFVYDEYYDVDAEKTKSGFRSVMPDTAKVPAKYLLAIRMFRRFEMEGHYAIFNMYSYKGYTTRISFDIPIAPAEKSFGSANTAFDDLPVLGQLGRTLDLPIVGITYAQAKLFLQWREKLANEYSEVKKTNHKVKARFIKQEEVTAWANDLGPHSTTNLGTHIDTMNTYCYLLNVKTDKPCPSNEKGIKLYGKGIFPVWAYFPDRLGIYNFFGNAWEMTDEEGIAIGGGWNDYGNVCDASKTVSYAGAEQWLGFRCVLEFYQ